MLRSFLNNLSLEVVYCNTALSNYSPIRLKRFISQFHLGFWNEFYQYSHLILLISGQIFEVTVMEKIN